MSQPFTSFNIHAVYVEISPEDWLNGLIQVCSELYSSRIKGANFNILNLYSFAFDSGL